MLTATRQSNSKKVLARETERADAPFSCPRCTREVILRKGKIKVHHFAHKPPVTCSLGTGETEQHFRAKLAIYDALLSEGNVTDLEIEKDFGISVADIFARIDGEPVVIEIQRSALSVNDIVTRTTNYHRLGIAVLWVGLLSSDLSTEQYSTARAHGKSGATPRTSAGSITGTAGKLFTPPTSILSTSM